MSFEIPSHCTALLAAKAGSDLTFAEIAKAIGKPEVWTTAVFFGQARTDEATAKKLVETLKIPTQYRYYWGEDPGTKTVTDEMIVHGLAGKGSGSMGVKGMVVRGGTWDGPPKVRASAVIRVLPRLDTVLTLHRTPCSTASTRSSSCTGCRTRRSSKKSSAMVSCLLSVSPHLRLIFVVLG
jgi:hypothetical protein